MHSLREQARLDSFVFISGPSKTADIEACMVNGAHGPREVHIVVLCEPIADKDIAAIAGEKNKSTAL